MEKSITGLMVYYYIVCKRKLWYFYNQISMESENDDVALGKMLDEDSYSRDEKHINIDNVINIDFIRVEGILNEVKKSKKIEKASIMQVKYYLYYFKNHGVFNIKGKIDYPLLKQSLDIELTSDDELQLENICKQIKIISNSKNPPEIEKKPYCKKCAYYELCFI